MTPAQIVILLEFLLDKSISLIEFKWSHTDNKLHLHFLDGGGNLFHKTFNESGKFIDWEV